MAAYKLSDPEFVDKIILEVKSQGHFDTFRKECLADVDTQPAYQNLHSRVEDTVQKYLNRQVWTPEIKNKNRLREEMRMNIIRAGFLESGVSRIVDQVVEQKMDYIQSKVEEILYNYVGIEKPKKEEKQQNGSLEIDTKFHSLIPTDLEQVSPDSSTDKKSPGSIKEEIEEELAEDEDFESPAFEPIESIKVEKSEVVETCENTNLSEISGLTSQDSPKSHKSEPTNIEGEQNKVDTALSQISSTQDNIPDTSEMEPPIVTSVIPVPGICSEEAQMATGLNDSTETEVKQLESEKTSDEPKCQFDLKKDQIEFTGTERKSINLDDSTNSGESEKVVQPQDVQNMEVENLYGNDTTDSSEMRMEIDLKDETTQETAMSSKIEESSQDSSKIKDKKSHKRDRSHDRSKSSSHKSSRHHHSSSSSKSKVDESSRHKSHSSAHKSSSSQKKSSEKEKDKDKARDKSSSSRKDHRDNRDKDKKPESSKTSKSKHEESKDDHHQEKSSSRRRRSTDHDSGDSKDVKQSNNPTDTNQVVNGSTKGTESKSTVQQQKSTEKSNNDEMESTKNQSKSNKEQKSSILVKYDYLKSSNSKQSDDEDMDSGFHGFEVDQLPKNPWFECIDMMKSNKFPFVSNNNYISKKNEGSAVKKTKSKTSDTADDTEQNTTVQKSQFASQRYESNDLYKPKFDFSRRRRGQVVEEDANKSRDTAPASN